MMVLIQTIQYGFIIGNDSTYIALEQYSKTPEVKLVTNSGNPGYSQKSIDYFNEK